MQTEIYCQMTNNTKCPFCGEEIQITAKKCKHCGEWLNNHCPICGELIPESSTICPICNTPIKKQNKKDYSNVFLILSILSIIASIIITLLFALVCTVGEPEEIADIGMKIVIIIFYTLFMFVPYFIPIISLCLNLEKKISSVAMVINTIVSIIFLFSLTFAGVIK